MSSAEYPDRFSRAAAAGRADAAVSGFREGWDTLLDKRFAHGVEPSGGRWPARGPRTP